MQLAVQRRATAAAQALLKESNPTLIVDGRPGPFTQKVYSSAPADLQMAVDSVVKALGAPGGFADLAASYTDAQIAAKGDSTGTGVFDLQVVPAIVRAAVQAGLNPTYLVGQVALESGFGQHTPIMPDGTPSYNYAGIKWDTAHRLTGQNYPVATSMTTEHLGGADQRLTQKFAVFSSPDDFAQTYVRLLQNGRYKGALTQPTAFEYGQYLQKAGYATDPAYAQKVASIISKATTRYSLA